jgi:RNA polymerase sigma-70 factor (ECF subfamily)
MRRPNPFGLHTDELLVALTIRGATNAFEELIRRHNSALRRFMLRLTKNYYEAEELSHETFIKAWQNLDRWQKTASFRSWLFAIGHNCFYDDVRKSKARKARERSWLDSQELISNQADNLEAAKELEQILQHFPSQQSAILELFYGDGFSHVEIANIMNMPLGSVKSNISRARAQIRNLLQAQQNDR